MADYARNTVNGTRRQVDGKECVFYEGYWIRYYAPPEDTLEEKRKLIAHLSRRLFHHTEAGINTPSERVELARAAFENESDEVKRRVNGAMLAGALFNRATEIFTKVVEVQQKGGHVSPENELLKQCADYFQEALDLGKSVRHYSGHEGIDELWGEPFKVFVMPLRDYYESRYVKIAQTMRDIERVADELTRSIARYDLFSGLEPLILELVRAAKVETETMRRDEAIFSVWPTFVAACDAVDGFSCTGEEALSAADRRCYNAGLQLSRGCRELVQYLAGARVPMPKSTEEFVGQCQAFARGEW